MLWLVKIAQSDELTPAQRHSSRDGKRLCARQMAISCHGQAFIPPAALCGYCKTGIARLEPSPRQRSNCAGLIHFQSNSIVQLMYSTALVGLKCGGSLYCTLHRMPLTPEGGAAGRVQEEGNSRIATADHLPAPGYGSSSSSKRHFPVVPLHTQPNCRAPVAAMPLLAASFPNLM